MGKNVQSLLIHRSTQRPARFRRQARRACDRKRRYKYGVHLPNPRYDAQDVAASLTRIGYETIVGLDLDKAGMDEHAIQFARRARDADVANLGRLKAGDVVLCELAPWPLVFIDDRVHFPYHAFDDQVDALIQFLTWTRENPPVAPRIIASSLGLRPR